METPSPPHPLQSILSSQSPTLNLLDNSESVRKYLQDINEKILEAEKQIHTLVSTHNEEFTNTLLYCKNLKDEATALNHRFTSIVQHVSHPEKGLYTSLITAITNYHAVQSEIGVLHDEIDLLGVLYEHYNSLDAFDSSFASHHYEVAASRLSRAHEVQGGNLRIQAVLADEYRARRNAMKKATQEALRNAVHGVVAASDKSDKSAKTDKNDMKSPSVSEKYTLQLQQSIHSLLKAIETLGEKEYTAAFSYLAQTIGQFFTFLLSNPSTLIRLEQVYDEWHFVAETTPQKVEHVPQQVVLHILGQCQEIFGIIAKFLFEDNQSFISHLGSLIWDDIANNIIKRLLATSIPEDNSQLAEYKTVIHAVETLEHTVQQLGYVPSDHPLASSIGKYAHDVDTHFALKKQRRLLARARKLLINADHNLTITVGTPESVADLSKLVMHHKPAQGKKIDGAHNFEEEESLLKLLAFPQCVISNAAHDLVDLIHQALHAHFASENESLYNNTMVIRSMVDLFRIVYSSHHKKLADVPQLSMVFHNDCFYVAQCISLILQRGDLNKDSVVDLVHSLRELGEASWLHTTTKQVDQIKEGIEAMGGLADVQEPKRKQAVERGFKMIMRVLKSSCDTLKGVLSFHLYFTTIGILVNTLFSILIRELENVEEIAEEESHILHGMLSTTMRDCEAFFKSLHDGPLHDGSLHHDESHGSLHGSPTPTAAAATAGANEEGVFLFLLSKYVPVWPKYSMAVALLEMPLAKIMEAHQAGRLAMFHATELQHLVLGLFSDSPLRKQLLDRLMHDMT